VLSGLISAVVISAVLLVMIVPFSLSRRIRRQEAHRPAVTSSAQGALDAAVAHLEDTFATGLAALHDRDEPKVGP
jgi:hypothetical protein